MKKDWLNFTLLLAVAGVCFTASVVGAEPPAAGEVVRGPFWSGTVRGKGRNEIIADKGIVITVGTDSKAHVCYDTDLMRLSLAWTGDFLEFGSTLTRIEWPPPPQVKGMPVFGTRPGPGWAKEGSLDDPRPNHQGPLPKDWAHFEGIYVHGARVVLKSRVGGVEVLETPGFENAGGQPVFMRTFQWSRSTGGQTLVLADGVEGSTLATDFAGDAGPAVITLAGGKPLAIGGINLPEGTRLETIAGGRVALKLARVNANQPFSLAFSPQTDPAGFVAIRKTQVTDLHQLTQAGPPHWIEPVVTKGVLGTGDEPYVVDTLTEPFPNPWNARTFFGGFDFFSDGRAAICTFHGDVWVVSGIDESMEKLAWRRYAAGMFQPLGLKIVDDTVYVLGRDQITRLHDLNHDGEADFYENFNNDIVVTPNYHEFALDLQTDSRGNFYFAKGSPWEPDVTSPHQGTLIKVSRDGLKFEVFAAGFRAPNGMTVGPHDEITVSDNQGHWMPASKLNWVKEGGFYGMTPAAQRELTLRYPDGREIRLNPSIPAERRKYGLKGWDGQMPIPTGYDEPLCWLPMNMDNSSGGQVWVTGGKWGPLKDHLLFMSYGKCTLFEMMMEQVDGVAQGGMVQFPLRFYSGLMRGRVNPRDGQVYVCGLKGWQTSATRDGGFYRVRYTAKPVHMPSALHVAKNGVEITFTSPLDVTVATDVENYSVEQWNYLWSGNYGSPEVSVNHPGEQRHDKVQVNSVRLSANRKTVFLEIRELKPCDQMKIKFNIAAEGGVPISSEIYNTVHRLGPEKRLATK